MAVIQTDVSLEPPESELRKMVTPWFQSSAPVMKQALGEWRGLLEEASTSSVGGG